MSSLRLLFTLALCVLSLLAAGDEMSRASIGQELSCFLPGQGTSGKSAGSILVGEDDLSDSEEVGPTTGPLLLIETREARTELLVELEAPVRTVPADLLVSSQWASVRSARGPPSRS